MSTLEYTHKNTPEILAEFGVRLEHGLENDEIVKQRAKYGSNELKSNQHSWVDVLIRQFRSPFVFLLIGAAVLALVLREFIDAFMVAMFVIINALLGFYQEFRSENTIKLLRQYVVAKAQVKRAGKEEEIHNTDLVPGDIVILEPGDGVPADIRIIEETNLTVDESVLTGESVSVHKISEAMPEQARQLFEAKNLCFSGTTVVSGRGIGVVIATGGGSSIGEIAKLTTESPHASSFEAGIGKFSKFILWLVLLTLAFLFAVNVVIKRGELNVGELLVFSVALAVSVIPEALPVVMTFSLSRGALRLAKNKVVVKRLSAIEDLGSVEILCTDKTGTLTENKLTLAEIYSHNEQQTLIYANIAHHDFENEKERDPFDVALWKKLSPADQKRVDAHKIIKELPFDPERRRNSLLTTIEGKNVLIVRGAAESLLAICDKKSIANETELRKWIVDQGRNGRRILAVAMKHLAHSVDDLKNAENDLEWVGAVAFVDPLKKTTREALNKARELGVQIKILTGDSPEVAGAVAHEVGLVASVDQVMTGEQFEALPEAEQHNAAHEFSVFARVSPQQKYRIIQVLQEKNEVGFLGEGINDAPALKLANVALVVESASDIAREAADIVLLKKSLNVIIDGIEEGRQVFANTMKYIKATLASNMGNFYAVAIASLLIDYLPMLPLQILLVNLLSDFPMIAIAADRVDADELHRPRSYNIKDIALVSTILGLVSSIFDFIFFALFYRMSAEILQTNWFIASIITELLFLFSIRTRTFMFTSRPPAPVLIYLSGTALVLTLIIPFTGIGHSLFKFISPSVPQLLIILMVALLYLATTEIVKLMYYNFFAKKQTTSKQGLGA